MIPFIIAAVIVVLDQISKYIISSNMEIGTSFNLIKYVLNITYTTNPGASFGMLKDHRWVFMTLSSVALVAMAAAIIYLIRKKEYIFMQISISFIFGGGIGNMIDRIAKGEVVDFLEFDFVSFAIFNVADSFITIGSVLFCICVFTGRASLFGGEKDENIDDGNSEEI